MDDLVKIAARNLRNNQTGSEKIFWDAVKQRKIMDLRFMRQHPVTFLYDNRERFFIADFYCAKKRLVVEIDGGIHEKQKDYDELREYIIKSLGYKMIRFTNEEINHDLDNVVKKLEKELSLLPSFF
ncbi:MAG TPA: endonuclease domain-containing protein [bacterium]|nr:endonuclease domain-containing protein [bacterium]HPS29557.1 endonuclease domain-containing protein [bacterium]